jgi:hypothetical protein
MTNAVLSMKCPHWLIVAGFLFLMLGLVGMNRPGFAGGSNS